MNCEDCKEGIAQQEPVPFRVHETAMARMERANRRLFWGWMVTLLLLCCGIIFFFWYEAQFTEEVTTQEVWQEADGDGTNNYTYTGGDYYGNTAAGPNDNAPENP